MSIAIVKLCLLRTGYFIYLANVLTRSPKIWHVNKRDSLEHNFIASDQWIWSRWCDADFDSVSARLPYCLSMHPLKRDFLDTYLTTFSGSVTSKIQKLWRSSFSPKRSKFQLDLKTEEKNSEKFFVPWDNCIWIGIVKLCLLRTGHFSSATNLLTTSPKNSHVNKTDFFQLNWLGSEQWIW